MVRFKYVKKPPQPQIDVVFPSLDIRPRPRKEMELIENFMSSKKYQAANSLIITAGHAGTDYKQGKGVTAEEMQEFCNQISPGTLKNFIQYQTFLLELILQIKDKNEPKQMQTMEMIEKWLKTLPELEQENLKIYARLLIEYLRSHNRPKILIDRLFSVFGEFPPIPEELLMK